MVDLPDGLAGLTPDEVLAFLRSASDDEVRRRVHGLGTATVLALLFAGWAERFAVDPRRGAGLLLFELDDDGTRHRHALALTGEGARDVVDPATAARATVRTTLVRFLRVAAGAQDPARLVVTGRLRLRGDAVWAVRTLTGTPRT